MGFDKRLRELRKEKMLTQEQLADITGISKSSISMYENGNRMPELETFEQLADYFNVDLDYLKCKSTIRRKRDYSSLDLYNSNDSVKINIYGRVPAGVPVEAVEDVIGEEEIPSEWMDGGQEFIALRVSGDSMYPKYLDGDIVIVRLQSDCESGQDAVVYVNGYDATLKTLIKQDDGMIRLQPTNPEFQPKIYIPNNITILGVVKRLRRDF